MVKKRKTAKKKPTRSTARKAPVRRRRRRTQDDLLGTAFMLPVAGIALGAAARF